MRSRSKTCSRSSASTRSNCSSRARAVALVVYWKGSPAAPQAAPVATPAPNACRTPRPRPTCRNARTCASDARARPTSVNPSAPRPGLAFLRTAQGWPYLLAPLIPVAVALELAHAPATVVFAASALGIIPTAALMGRATEELSARSGPGIGGFLNVTFGNAPELIIALFALGAGLHEVVKASLVGSILGNILLVLGGAMLVGGIGRDRQRFNA